MQAKTKRLPYMAFGWTMFVLGFIGAFLPVFPTTL